MPAPDQKERGHAGFEDHPTEPITTVHRPVAVVAIDRNRWSSSIGMTGRHQIGIGGRHQSVRAVWEEDWRVMQLPGRMETQRALVADYGNYVARFDEIGEYLTRWQPPSLMIWARHDPFFDLSETLSWMRALPRMEAHILDAGHKLLETHAAAAASLMLHFIGRTGGKAKRAGE